MKHLQPINVMETYPVHWDKACVLRDFLQNFYDALGYEQFNCRCRQEFVSGNGSGRGEMRIVSVGIGFDYRWLVHFGATTKQEESGKFAGFFGEGFKVAALCAVRDHGWTIKMQSRDWTVNVCFTDCEIDGRVLRQLTYEIDEEGEAISDTVMTIGNFVDGDAALLSEVILGFYYPENPLFGDLVYSNGTVAIHKRSDCQKPDRYPISYKCSGDGIVFIAYQARGSLPIPVVICNHRYRTEDRDRENVSCGDVHDVLFDLINNISAEAARYLLEALKPFWYSYPKSREDTSSWYSVIRKLIVCMAYSREASEAFRSKYSDLATCEPASSIIEHNRKSLALSWRRGRCPHIKLVQDNFERLGYKPLTELCDEAGGFDVTRVASAFEKALIDILQAAAKKILGRFILTYPICDVISNSTAVRLGTANLVKNKWGEVNSWGYKVMYDCKSISLKARLFSQDSFAEAFSTYCHELCHCFGTDASVRFSLALTSVISLITAKMNELPHFESEWARVFRDFDKR